MGDDILKEVEQMRLDSKCIFENLRIDCKGFTKNGKTEKNHRIQENKYLVDISQNKKVRSFYIYNKNFHRLGRKLSLNHISKVHRHPVFCGAHDKDVFKNIENNHPFDKENIIQIYQFAFRAFIFSHHEHKLKQVRSDKNWLFEKRYQLALKEYEEVLEKFKTSYVTENYDIFNSYTIELDKKIEFITSTDIIPILDLKGKRRKTTTNAQYFLNIFPQGEKSYIVISYFKENEKYCKSLIDQMSAFVEKKQFEPIELYLNKIIASHDMNIVINPRLYDKWSNVEKNNFYKFAHLLKINRIFEIFRVKRALRTSTINFDLFREM